MRVRIEYADQNEAFAACLPREGTVVAVLESASGDQWHQISLDDPIDYQLKVNEPFGCRRLVTDVVLIKPRLVGGRIGIAEPVDIHLYLVEPRLPIASPLAMNDHVPACWALCRTVPGAA